MATARAGDQDALRSLHKWSTLNRQTREYWHDLLERDRTLAFMASDLGRAHLRAVRRATDHAQERYDRAMYRTWADSEGKEERCLGFMPVHWMESYSRSMGFPQRGRSADDERTRARTVAKIAAEFGGDPAHPRTEEQFYADLIEHVLQQRNYGYYSSERVDIPPTV